MHGNLCMVSDFKQINLLPIICFLSCTMRERTCSSGYLKKFFFDFTCDHIEFFNLEKNVHVQSGFTSFFTVSCTK